jgi:hypothetical protein
MSTPCLARRLRSVRNVRRLPSEDRHRRAADMSPLPPFQTTARTGTHVRLTARVPARSRSHFRVQHFKFPKPGSRFSPRASTCTHCRFPTERRTPSCHGRPKTRLCVTPLPHRGVRLVVDVPTSRHRFRRAPANRHVCRVRQSRRHPARESHRLPQPWRDDGR